MPEENRFGATRNFVAIRIGQLLCFQLIQFLGVSPVWRSGGGLEVAGGYRCDSPLAGCCARRVAPWIGAYILLSLIKISRWESQIWRV